LIITLVVTIIIEGMIVLVYCTWYRKPLGPILFTSILGNLITQSILWVVLNVFFQHYVVALISAEVFIWILESLLLYGFRANQLCWQEAALLSLIMNVTSFGLGWFLPA
jgi:hypothetical protein